MPLDLLALLRRRGPSSGGEIVRDAGVSRPTLMRAVRAAGDGLVVQGRARSTRYAARRALRGSMSPLPLYRVGRDGRLQRVATLDLCHPHGCAVDPVEAIGWPVADRVPGGWFDGLPYWLHDMRPQGFLGRHFARAHAALLQVSDDPTRWSDDDALHALSLLGSDTPGDLVVGEPAARRWLEQVAGAAPGDLGTDVGDDTLAEAYPRLAAQAMAAGVAGSSAGGEFPKFTARRRSADDTATRQVLVKFSGHDGSAGTRRWSDLLVCEHLAGEVLRDRVDVPAARSRVLSAGGRTFLEVDRFDRHGAHGRSGVVSWMALDADLVGAGGRPWPDATRALVDHGWLPAADGERIRRLWLFGRLIANTDMHDGNLGFQPAPSTRGPGVALAPAYDMLPMLYAPLRGVELPDRDWTPPLPLPDEREAWTVAARGARAFWERAAADARIGDDFRRICERNAARVRAVLG